ncbi:phytoene/squalene synthase family protein [Priestia megaterium]|uniref:phytoene/squalene synthase family protein n=1 Tax=Priestia megaterium TaxID=1404 RepID=UPI00263BD2F3|nr:phytoene/squalene synthase family protein [Priestia megaterium]MDN4860670.1 phytoene/squalene synthase family protein [Priestia megaterium]
MMNISLDKAYNQCEEIIKENSKTFYKAFSMLPSKQRKAVWAVYAFCRQVDDIVDEGCNPEIELQQFESEFARFKNGELLNESAMWVALRNVFEQYEMNVQAFDHMITGQRMDLVKKEYDTLDEVKTYSYHVASTVGLMLLPILAPTTHKELEEEAVALGIAMQLTNILRDVGEDLERGRIYLPKDLMNSYGYMRMLLENRWVTSEFIEMWEHLAKEAEMYYIKGLQSIHKYPVASRLPLTGAAHLYRAILDKIRKENYDVFTEKHFVTSQVKKKIMTSISTG